MLLRMKTSKASTLVWKRHTCVMGDRSESNAAYFPSAGDLPTIYSERGTFNVKGEYPKQFYRKGSVPPSERNRILYNEGQSWTESQFEKQKWYFYWPTIQKMVGAGTCRMNTAPVTRCSSLGVRGDWRWWYSKQKVNNGGTDNGNQYSEPAANMKGKGLIWCQKNCGSKTSILEQAIGIWGKRHWLSKRKRNAKVTCQSIFLPWQVGFSLTSTHQQTVLVERFRNYTKGRKTFPLEWIGR